MTGREGVPTTFFHSIYAGGVDAGAVASDAPWDLGHAQPAVEELIRRGALQGRVLDVGCGPGDNAIAMARAGADVLAVDFVPAAVEKARARAAAQGVGVALRVADALDLAPLGRTFDAVLDSGTFHVFSDADRARYAASVAAVLAPGGALHLLCFSDEEPPGPGPRHVSRAEIAATFGGVTFEVESIERVRFYTRAQPDGARALLARVRRSGAEAVDGTPRGAR
jgi:SAM-dependent methyltransferase